MLPRRHHHHLRSNAVRVLCQIVDSQLLAQIERYLKQAVVDKSPVVAASVLVSALHLMHNVSQQWGSGRSSSGSYNSSSRSKQCLMSSRVFDSDSEGQQSSCCAV